MAQVLGALEPTTTITNPGDPPPEGQDLSVADDVSRQVYLDTLQLKYSELRQALAVVVLGAGAFWLMQAANLPRRIPGFIVFAALGGLIWAARIAFGIVQLRRTDPDRMLTTERVDGAQWSRDLAAHRERAVTIKPAFTNTLIIVLAAIGALEAYVGLAPAVQRAALVKPAVFAGEWWRMLTAAFLHGSPMHLSSNLAALAFLGSLIETYAPRTRVALVFFVSAIAGSIASTLATSVTSLGASGGIVGLAGYLFVLSARGADGTPGWIKKHIKRILVSTALVGVALFFMIDNAAHAGGAIAGVMLGWITIPKPGRTISPAMSRALDQLGWLAVDVLAAGAVFTVWRLLH